MQTLSILESNTAPQAIPQDYSLPQIIIQDYSFLEKLENYSLVNDYILYCIQKFKTDKFYFFPLNNNLKDYTPNELHALSTLNITVIKSKKLFTNNELFLMLLKQMECTCTYQEFQISRVSQVSQESQKSQECQDSMQIHAMIVTPSSLDEKLSKKEYEVDANYSDITSSTKIVENIKFNSKITEYMLNLENSENKGTTPQDVKINFGKYDGCMMSYACQVNPKYRIWMCGQKISKNPVKNACIAFARHLEGIESKTQLHENIYILKLEDDKYYIGRTIDIKRRWGEHSSGVGSSWTKKYKPVSIVEVHVMLNQSDENNFTKICMLKYGVDNVRGGSYCTLTLLPLELDEIHKTLNKLNEYSTVDDVFRIESEGLPPKYLKEYRSHCTV